ncbi:MAG: nuclear transport factor 2 family protein [Acidobacteriota bacterium]
MQPKTATASDESAIRELMNDRVKAIRAKDVNGLMSNHAPDVLAFDLLIPLQYIGSDVLKKRAEVWLSSFQGPVSFEMRNLSVTAGNDVAFCHSLNGVSGTKTDGEKIEMWWRATVCLRKIDGKWMVTHEHSSVPFEMESGKADMTLKP